MWENDDVASHQVVRLVLSVEGEVGLASEHEVELGGCGVVNPKAPRGSEVRPTEDDAADVDASQRVGEVVCQRTDSAHTVSIGPAERSDMTLVRADILTVVGRV